MKHSLLTTAIFAFTLHLNGNTIYVKQQGNGNGTTWNDANGNLADALFKAKSGDEIWVAAGTYYPTHDTDRKKSFVVPDGVKLYGGFKGNETLESERNFQLHKTVLSGNIGSKTEFTDNSYTVVYMKYNGTGTILDGFIIADGNSDGTGPTADKDRCGGALYIDGSGVGKLANPTIQNCVFQNNHARDGGATYLNGRSGECSPTFRNCQFLNNVSDLDGGAVFNDGRHDGHSSPTFEDCYFIANQGNYGGALCNYGGKGQSNPRLKNCVFRNNEAHLRGGAVFNMDVQGIAKPVINDCQFIDNKAVAGMGVYTFSQPANTETTPAAEKATYKEN